MWEIFQIWLERGTWILFLGLQPTKSQKRWWFFYRWLACKNARAIFILACPPCRDFGVWVISLSVPIDPSNSCERITIPMGPRFHAPATCNLRLGLLLCFSLVYPYHTSAAPSDCMYFAAALQRSCGDPAAQLLAQRRGQTLCFFFRDEKWYPDLARCDGSCRISFSHTHTHTLSHSLCSPLA